MLELKEADLALPFAFRPMYSVDLTVTTNKPVTVESALLSKLPPMDQ
jgi:hypothetical protein